MVVAKLPSTGCQFGRHVFQARKQVSNKNTGLIALKFGDDVLFEMATEWLGFDNCVAIIVATVAIWFFLVCRQVVFVIQHGYYYIQNELYMS